VKSQPARFLVLHNPTSGSEDGSQRLVEALTRHNIPYKLVEVFTPPEAKKILSILKPSQYKAIAVSAGDGTVIAAVKSVYDKNIPVLILPGGSANLLAKALNLPTDLEDCVALLSGNKHEVIQLPLADIGNDKLLLDVHFGFWSRAIKRTSQASKQRIGQAAYGIAAVKQLLRAKKRTYTFTVDGQTFSFRAHALYVANQGEQQFAGVPLFLKRSPDLLYVAAIRTINPVAILYWMLMRNLNREAPRVIQTLYGKDIRLIEVPKSGLFDDDSYEPELPLNIRVSQDKVSLIQAKLES